MSVLTEEQLYIHGRAVKASSNEHFLSINPASNEAIARLPMASKNDVDKAVESAQAAFEAWKHLTGTARGRILRKASDILRKRNDELARLEVMDTGKPISEALVVDVQSGADCLEYFSGLAPAIHGEQFPLGPSAFAYTQRVPLGVCAGIGAWNYPLQIACWKSAPALASGNAMIFKPSELTSLTALKLAEIYTEAGLPDGVFNVVLGGSEVGRMLSLHEGIRKISLTGEVSTGKAVMKDASSNLKAVTMELGGKSPLIVFEDASLKNALSAALMANFFTQGEICSNGTRVFVHRSCHDDFVEQLVKRTQQIRVGDPMLSETQMGALISEEHMQRVLHYINQGKKEGARLLCGGNRFVQGSSARGFFVEPTIFDQCTDQMTIVQEEIFGPVMSVLAFDSEEEVIERANRTAFGLAAGLFTKDIARAHRVATKLEAGIVWINNYNITPIEIPFGGMKQSGLGRENSLAAIDHYTQKKTVYVELGQVESPF